MGNTRIEQARGTLRRWSGHAADATVRGWRQTLRMLGKAPSRIHRVATPPQDGRRPSARSITGDVYVCEREGMAYRYEGNGKWTSMVVQPQPSIPSPPTPPSPLSPR